MPFITSINRVPPSKIEFDPIKENVRWKKEFNDSFQAKKYGEALNICFYNMTPSMERDTSLRDILPFFLEREPLQTMQFLNCIEDQGIKEHCQITACVMLGKKGNHIQVIRQIADSTENITIQTIARRYLKG